MCLKDKVAVVTGGSRGIGRAVAFALARRGAKVMVCARNEDDLNKTSEAIGKEGGACIYKVADISDEKQVGALASETLSVYGRADVLVNNAGVGAYVPLVDSTPEDWDRIIDTNLKGAFLCSRAFVPIMMERKTGYIINIASGAGKSGMKNLSIYCASKFGLVGFTESIKKELKGTGVKALCLCPGYVKTGFFRNYPPGFHLPSNAVEPEDVAEKVVKSITRRGKMKPYFNMFAGFVKRFQIAG
jgi:3-oxoacyl-[acyl-carrier protein] reductase